MAQAGNNAMCSRSKEGRPRGEGTSHSAGGPGTAVKDPVDPSAAIGQTRAQALMQCKCAQGRRSQEGCRWQEAPTQKEPVQEPGSPPMLTSTRVFAGRQAPALLVKLKLERGREIAFVPFSFPLLVLSPDGAEYKI